MESVATTSIKLVLKVKATEEVVRLSFDAPVTLDAIKAAAVRQWPEQAAGAEFKYVDNDGDSVLLVAEGVGEALRHHGGPVLKLFVVPKTSTGACAENARWGGVGCRTFRGRGNCAKFTRLSFRSRARHSARRWWSRLPYWGRRSWRCVCGSSNGCG